MKKPFCDLCGKPAHKGELTAVKDCGEPWRGGGDSTVQPVIYMTVTLHAANFRDRRQEPDLCPDCIYQLLDDVAKKLIPEKPADPIKAVGDTGKPDA